MVEEIVEKEQVLKGLFTVMITSLVYKCLYSEQDVRYHQKIWKMGTVADHLIQNI